MAVKIRLARRGRKKMAMYDVVVADARAPRDGRFIEKIGTYNPNTNPASIQINEDSAFKWVMNGAQPTDTVRAMLSYRGILFKKHLQIGVNKGAITQEEADKRFEDWKNKKENTIQSKKDTLAKSKADAVQARREAEAKVKEARAEAIRKKSVVEEPVAEAPAEEEVATEAPVVETPEAPAAEATVEETPTAEAPAEEAPAAETPVEETPAAEEAKDASEEEKKD
jgi:small subunit ribosomal protein S16